MASVLNRLPDGTIELTLTMPWPAILAAYETQVRNAIDSAELPGFRKGKAPRELVEPKLDRSQLYSTGLQDLLPKSYSAAVTEHQLKPILYPKIALKSGQDGQDWVFVATTCELPVVTLPNYQAEIPKLKSETKDQRLTTILDYLAREAKVTIPSLLVEEEANHRLAALADNLTNLGMTTDKYLATKNLKADSHKAALATQARTELALELTLGSIQAKHQHATRQETLDFLTALV